MNIRKIIAFMLPVAIAALIVGLSSCDQISQIVQPTTPQTQEPSEEITIGVVLPLTGRLTDSFGKSMQQGFELALNEINSTQSSGAQLKFIIEDDQSTVEGAVAAFNKLTHQEGVSVILGPATSSQTEEAFQIAQENQVVAISPTSAARGLSAIGDFVFRVALTTDVLTPSGIEATQAKLGYQKAATMYDKADLFSTDADAALQEVLTANGVEVLITETFQSGDTDFSEQLTRIQALNPDAIFVSSLPPEKPGILTQGHQLGISAPFIVRTLTGADVQTAGPAAEGAITFIGWGTAISTPGNQAFVQNYSTKYGMEPNNYAARSYVTLHILAAAIANAQSTDSASIREALANIKDFDTIFGKFSFDANGDAVYDAKVLTVKDGELVRFE
jgi:branched-chain amino acid transport system substrate-binding protein